MHNKYSKKNNFSLSNSNKGVIVFLLTCALYALLNCLIRKISYSLNPYIMVSYRSIATIIILLPFMFFLPIKDNAKYVFSKTNIYKAAADFLSMPLWFMAIAKLQIAEAVSLSYTTPLFAALLASTILKEKVGIEKGLALIIGFCGVLLLINPKIDSYNIYSFAVLGASILWAIGSVLTKNLAQTQPPIIIVFYTNIIICLFSMPFIILKFQSLDMNLFLIIFGAAVISCIASIGLAYSCGKSRLIELLPYDYTRMIFATIFGYIFFEESIGFNIILGSIVILLASVFIANYDHIMAAKTRN